MCLLTDSVRIGLLILYLRARLSWESYSVPPPWPASASHGLLLRRLLVIMPQPGEQGETGTTAD
jgi:hypothetical protein